MGTGRRRESARVSYSHPLASAVANMHPRAVAQLGQQWEKISERVGRTASDCRDRWRNHLEGQNIRRSGHWTKEEEEELTRIVSEVTILQGKDIDNDIFWGAVSQRMGGRRGRQQCRIKWYVYREWQCCRD